MKEYANLYIHVPFCRRKCGYCAFYSLPCADDGLYQLWLEKLLLDLRKNAPGLQKIRTLYFGGGTPSSLPVPVLKKLFRTIQETCRFEPGAEITMEANPETVTTELCDTAAGFINRVSMGVQSFQPELRRAVMRHTGGTEHVCHALEAWRSAGVENLGFDLLYALPGETLVMFRNDLEEALSCGVKHLSCYSITPEEGTPFAATGYEPDEGLSADMWNLAGEFLARHDMPRYEISNYASKPFRAAHNWNVWHGESYLGLGPSAASFDGVRRWTECADLQQWAAGVSPEYDEIPRAERLREILLMGLRTADGWGRGEFRSVTGVDPDFPVLAALEREKLLLRGDDGVILPTEQGLLFWNDLALRILE